MHRSKSAFHTLVSENLFQWHSKTLNYNYKRWQNFVSQGIKLFKI